MEGVPKFETTSTQVETGIDREALRTEAFSSVAEEFKERCQDVREHVLTERTFESNGRTYDIRKIEDCMVAVALRKTKIARELERDLGLGADPVDKETFYKLQAARKLVVLCEFQEAEARQLAELITMGVDAGGMGASEVMKEAEVLLRELKTNQEVVA